MKASTKQLLSEIDRTNKILKHQHKEVLKNKALLHLQATNILSIIIPGLVLGWKIGKEKGLVNIVKQAAKLMMMQSLKRIEKQILLSSRL